MSSLTEVFYIVVTDKVEESVVATSSAEPRLFPKRKKAANFIAGRPALRTRLTRIVTDISGIDSRWKANI